MHTLPIYLVVMFLTILQSSYGQYPIGPPCPNPGLDPRYVVIPQYTSGSIFSNAPSVAIFTDTFLKACYTTDILREVFDLSQTSAKEYADFVRGFTQDVLFALGIENAAALAEFASRAIPQYFDVLTLPVVARAYANIVANFLYVDGYLGIDNAKDLGMTYAQFMVKSAQDFMNSDPKSKFFALGTGFAEYLLSIECYTKSKAELVAYYTGNEWFVAGVNYRFL